MTRRFYTAIVFAIAFSIIGNSATRVYAANWNEAIDGDLNNLGQNPSHFALEPGANIVSGNITAIDDEDYIYMQIPTGIKLEAIILLNHSSSENQTLFAMDTGYTYQSVILQDAFGYAEADSSSIGEDILSDMAISNNRFTPPLPVNDFTLWIHQSEASIDYSLEFLVAPEPASLTLLTIGYVVIFRKKRKQA